MNLSELERVKHILDEKEFLYNNPTFIPNDPICIPHSYTLKQDVEIMGFFASIFAWGLRATIIKKCRELGNRMDNAPLDFIKNHTESDLRQLLGFKHRTFNDTDLLYCIDFMKRHYSKHQSLEDAFIPDEQIDWNAENALIYFHNYFFESEHAPKRTGKHISTPARKSACKRLNMYLRWMVRKDNKGVDFGIWNKLRPSDLICPLDLHVERTARNLGIMVRDKSDWLAASELTNTLKLFDSHDPVKYDFALFGISIEKLK